MYYIIFGFFYLLSLLPFRVIYALSDLVFLLIYHVFGYRRKIVMSNLAIAFPEKTEAERTAIAKKFYRAFTDNWLEAVKLLSISRRTLARRFQLDHGPVPRLHAEGKSCQVHLGHQFNWEWANAAFGTDRKYLFLGVYQPISNKAINRLFRYFRERNGTVLLSARNMGREMLPYRNRQFVLGLIADQNPPDPRKARWVQFFTRKAPFIAGIEKNARAHHIPVVFARTKKIRRGYYRCTLELVAEDPASLPEGELTVRFVRFLEESLRQQPENWLWSHRRWKHREEDYGF